MTKIAQKADLNRQSLYKALSGNSAPTFDAVVKVLQAFGLKLTLAPADESMPAAQGPCLMRGVNPLPIPVGENRFKAKRYPLCDQIFSDLICQGCRMIADLFRVLRTQIPGDQIGNTAEAVFHQLMCSILAVKPLGFTSPVKSG